VLLEREAAVICSFILRQRSLDLRPLTIDLTTFCVLKARSVIVKNCGPEYLVNSGKANLAGPVFPYNCVDLLRNR